MKEKFYKKKKILLFFTFFISFIFSFLFPTSGQQNGYEINNTKIAYFTDGVILPLSVQNGKFNAILIFDRKIEKIFLDKIELDIIENGSFRISYFALPLNYKKNTITIKIEKDDLTNEFNINAKEKEPYQRSEIVLDSNKQSIVSPENSAKREEETRFFNNLLSRKSNIRYFTLPFVNPLEVMKIISLFGNSRIYKDKNGNTLYTSVHLGVDLKASINTKVFAVSSGKIVFAGFSLTRGNCVYIDHGFGLFTSYFHLNKVLVKEDQIVFAGDLIGLSGNTGVSTGPHLHLGAILNGASIDPLSLIKEMNELEENYKIIMQIINKQ